MKRDITKFSFFRTFFRSLNPKKYRFLVLEKFSRAFFFFFLIILISSFMNLILNYQALSLVDVQINYSEMQIDDVMSNTFLVNSVIKLITSEGLSFFIFIFPSIVFYLIFYLFFKYLLISFLVSLIFFLIIFIFKLELKYIKMLKMSLFSISIMILFDLVPIYTKYQISFILYVLLYCISLYFVSSSKA